MDKQENFNAETLKSLEKLNNQVSELIQVQRKAITGYDYINVNELSQLLGESISTIYNRVHQKQIPYYKPGGKVLLFKIGEIEDWIKSGRHSPIDEIRQNI